MNSVKSERLNDPLGFLLLAPLAQLAEHRTLNPQVPGSSPGGRTPKLRTRKNLTDSDYEYRRRGRTSELTPISTLWPPRLAMLVT